MRLQRHPIASYQKPAFAFSFTVSRLQVSLAPMGSTHSLSSHRSIMPPVTISLEGDWGSRMTDTYNRYCTFGSSTRPNSLRLMVWMPGCCGVGIVISLNHRCDRSSRRVKRTWYPVVFDKNQLTAGVCCIVYPT